MNRLTSGLLGSSLCAYAFGGLCLLLPNEAHAYSCYIAYIHGSGSRLQDAPFHEGFNAIPADPADGGDRIEAEWTPDRSPADTTYNSFTFRSSKAELGNDGCAVFRVGYDGIQGWWQDGAAALTAAQLNDFITEYDIPDGNLIIIAHSMGGLVGRWILNQGVPNAPYYNYSGDYARIVQKTKYMITLSTPHGGTQLADAVYGEADHYFSDAAADIARWFAGQDQTDARWSMRRAYMQDAATSWLGDEGRISMIYTVAGYSVEDDAGEGLDDDGKLQIAWGSVCYRSSWVNGDGTLCDVTNTLGDGLVELTSSEGVLPYGGTMQGAYQNWLEMRDNHNQIRYDMHYAPVYDLIANTTQDNYPGTYIASWGLNLPCSTTLLCQGSGAEHF